MLSRGTKAKKATSLEAEGNNDAMIWCSSYRLIYYTFSVTSLLMDERWASTCSTTPKLIRSATPYAAHWSELTSDMQLGDTNLHLQVISDPWVKLSQVECDLRLDPDFSLGEVVVSRFHLICHPIKLIGCPVNSVGTGSNWVKLSVTLAIRYLVLLSDFFLNIFGTCIVGVWLEIFESLQ